MANPPRKFCGGGDDTFYGYRPADVIKVGGERGKPGQSVKGDKGERGLKGEQGIQGIAGLGAGNTDDVPEGTGNLYYTEVRTEAAIALALELAAGNGDGVNLSYDLNTKSLYATNTDKGSVAVVTHANTPDPHPQYLDEDDILDGGNF